MSLEIDKEQARDGLKAAIGRYYLIFLEELAPAELAALVELGPHAKRNEAILNNVEGEILDQLELLHEKVLVKAYASGR